MTSVCHGNVMWMINVFTHYPIIVYFVDCRMQPFADGSFGANMMKLTWDEELEKAASGWAHALCIKDQVGSETPGCRKTNNYDSVGQNVAHGRYANDEENTASLVIQTW